MSRVATNYPAPRFSNGDGLSPTSFLTRSSSGASTDRSIGNSRTRGVGQNPPVNITVRSAAPPPTLKETVHACPICNGEYKDPRVLPCTHTYCLNCIRDNLIDNNQLTCPKCHHQVQSFDENELNSLPTNPILSQVWRMTLQPITSIAEPKKAVTNQSTHSSTSIKMPNQQDKRKSSITDKNEIQTPTHETKPHGIAAIVNALSRASGNSTKTGSRSSRSSSVSSAQPVVSNLVKIYSEVTACQQQTKFRSDSVASTGKHDELVKIFEQATKSSQHQKKPSASISKRPSQAVEEAYEEMTWDTLVHGSIPAPPPFPDEWQSATVKRHHPPDAPERPLSAASSDLQSNTDPSPDMIVPTNQQFRELTSSFYRQGLTTVPQVNSRPSTASHSQNGPDEDGDIQMSIQPSIYATIQPRERSRQESHIDSARSSISSSIRGYSPAPPMINSYPQKTSITTTSQQSQQKPAVEKPTNHTPSIALSPRRSPDKYSSHGVGTIFFGGESAIKQRTPSATSLQSSVSDDHNEQKLMNQAKLSSMDRFKTPLNIPHPMQTNKSSHMNSQTNGEVSVPMNRSASRSIERETHYLTPTPPLPSTTTAVTSRVDFLLSDHKCLEREIEEQMRRLQHDYDDTRKQIERKESSIQNEIKTMVSNLDLNVTEHYRRKQKIYADLAADTDAIGNELQRLKSLKNTKNNKEALWDQLEQIEHNIKNIRRAVEQQKELGNDLTFAEGHRTIATDTIGQITYNQTESHRRFNTPPSTSPSSPVTASLQIEQTPTNIMPFKYLKIDHLSTLEPEAIAVTENNKKVLLGICNKLFILNEYGDTLKTILLSPSIRGITISKKYQSQNIAYISHDETVSMIDIESGQTLDCVKETDSTGESGTFLPLGIDTDNLRGDVYVCDYRNSCVIKFDDKLEFITQWRVYNHSDQYDEARPKLISAFGQKLYMIVEHSCKSYYNQGIAYTFSLHICDANSGNIIKIIDADALGTQRLRWPCSIQAMSNEKCYILDTMTSGKYFNGQWQKHWSRVLEIGQDSNNLVTELFQLDSEAEAMAMTKENMLIAANGDILFVDLSFLFKKQQHHQQQNTYDHNYQNLP